MAEEKNFDDITTPGDEPEDERCQECTDACSPESPSHKSFLNGDQAHEKNGSLNVPLDRPTNDIELVSKGDVKSSTDLQSREQPPDVEDDESGLDDGLCKTGLCREPVYRNKIVNTIWLWWLSVVFGWLYGQIGPTLPDLQLLSDVGLQQASWLFTSFAIGYLFGCVVSGIIHGRLHPLLLLFLYIFFNGIVVGALPWSTEFYVMVTLRLLGGACCGGIDTSLHARIFAIWGPDAGPYLQVVHFLTATGGILSPLVTGPFLSNTPEDVTSGNTTNLNMTSNNASGIFHQTPNSTGTEYVEPAAPETRVQYAFLITGFLLVTCSIPFLVLYLKNRKSDSSTINTETEEDVFENMSKKTKRVKYVAFAIACLISLFGTAFVDMFPSFLMSFGVYQLGWTTDQGSSATALFFGLYAVGNVFGMLVLKCLKTGTLIFISYVVLACTMAGLVVGVIYSIPSLIWVLIAANGLAMSPIMPTIFTWTQENVIPITGPVSSIFLTSGSVGAMVNPLLLGYLMDNFTPMWFLYITSGQVVFCAVLFTSNVILMKKFAEKPIETKIERQTSVSTARTVSGCYKRRCMLYC